MGLVTMVVGVTVACSAQSYYRVPQQPTSAGSWSNDVLYAYFTVSPPVRYSLPPSFTEFNPDTDTSVTFVLRVKRIGSESVVRGVLRRPDRNVHVSFERDVPRSFPGGTPEEWTHEEFAMKSLAPWQGSWTLELFRDGEQIGRYRFLLADRESFQRRRSENIRER